MSHPLNGWRRDYRGMDVPFMPPATEENPPQPLGSPYLESARALADDPGLPRVTPRVVPTVPTREPWDPEYSESHHKHHCPECWELLMKTLILKTGEVHYPVGEMEVSLRTDPDDRGIPGLTGMRFVRRLALRVTRPEGESLIHWMKLFVASFIGSLMLVLLTSFGTKEYLTKDSWQHNASGAMSVLLGILPLASAFSLGVVVQKLGSYGWRRFLRLLWVRLSQRESLRIWREGVHSLSDFAPWKKER